MSGSVNKVILVGNLGADPEARNLPSGGKVVNLRVATSESWRDKNSGERKERTEWHSVVVFNESLAKVAEQYLRKGSKVYLEGQLQTRRWQHQDGQDRFSTEVVLQNFGGVLTMLDSPDGGRQEAPAQTRYPADKTQRKAPAPAFGLDGGGSVPDDIPFMPEWR